MQDSVPDVWLLEVGGVFGILQFDHNMVREEREVLQRLDTEVEVLVAVDNDRGCLGGEGEGGKKHTAPNKISVQYHGS